MAARANLDGLAAFVAVAWAGGFRAGGGRQRPGPQRGGAPARGAAGPAPPAPHHAQRRARLLARLGPAPGEVEAAIEGETGLDGQLAGTLRLNVPVSAARLVLPVLVPSFLALHPGIRLEVIAEDGFVDVLAAGCDAGIRYEERLEPDMIALPIGPRAQRLTTTVSPPYLDRRGRPEHPRDLLDHDCVLVRFPGRAMLSWEFERAGEVVRVDPTGPLVASFGTATDLAVEAARAGLGIVSLFEEWLRPHLASGALEPVLEPWWPSFAGPFLILFRPPPPARLPARLRGPRGRGPRGLVRPRWARGRRLLRPLALGRPSVRRTRAEAPLDAAENPSGRACRAVSEELLERDRGLTYPSGMIQPRPPSATSRRAPRSSAWR